MKKEIICAILLVAGLTGVATPAGALARGVEKGATRVITRTMVKTATKTAVDAAARAGSSALKAGCRLQPRQSLQVVLRGRRYWALMK